MITDVLTSYLEDESVEDSKKYELLQRCNLKYSDALELRERYKYDSKIYRIVDAAFNFGTTKLIHKIEKQNRKFEEGKKLKKLNKLKKLRR